MSITRKVLAAAATPSVAGGLNTVGNAARGRGDSAVRPALRGNPGRVRVSQLWGANILN